MIVSVVVAEVVVVVAKAAGIKGYGRVSFGPGQLTWPRAANQAQGRESGSGQGIRPRAANQAQKSQQGSGQQTRHRAANQVQGRKSGSGSKPGLGQQTRPRAASAWVSQSADDPGGLCFVSPRSASLSALCVTRVRGNFPHLLCLASFHAS